MTEFSKASLLGALRNPAFRMKVVMLEEIPDDVEQPISTYHLDLQDDLEAQFKRNLAESIDRWPPEDAWDQYIEGWVPEEGQFASAGRDVLTGSRLLEAIDRGLEPGRVRLPQLGDPDIPRARGYALVLAEEGSDDETERIYLVRRRDPVEHFDRGHITALWSETRLTLAHGVVGFDSGIDVAVWRDKVVIRSLPAFEALFFPRAVRTEAAVRAVNELNGRLPIENLDLLLETAREDSLFAARLRRLSRQPRFGELSLADLRPSLRRFGLEARFISGGQLTFDRARWWRWPFLAALEDGLVESPGSRHLYQSTSQRRWERRHVTAGVRTEGTLTALCGEGWGPTLLAEVGAEIDRAKATYFVGTPDDPVEVMPEREGDRWTVAARSAAGGDELAGLPDCA